MIHFVFVSYCIVMIFCFLLFPSPFAGPFLCDGVVFLSASFVSPVFFIQGLSSAFSLFIFLSFTKCNEGDNRVHPSLTRPSFDIRNAPGAGPETARNQEMRMSKEDRISYPTRLVMFLNVPGISIV